MLVHGKGRAPVGALKCNKKLRQVAINVEFISSASFKKTALVLIYSSLKMSVSRVYLLFIPIKAFRG